MSRLPIRVQMTAAFAVAMVALLVASGSFVYFRLRSDLDEGVNAALLSRADAVLAVFSESSPEVAKANIDVTKTWTNKYVEQAKKTTGTSTK